MPVHIKWTPDYLNISKQFQQGSPLFMSYVGPVITCDREIGALAGVRDIQKPGANVIPT